MCCPAAVAAKAYRELGIANPKAAELPDILNQGLQKLYGFQHGDGSWGWFYADDGGVFLTSYVLYGLSMVKANGVAVDAGVLDRGFAYVDSPVWRRTKPRHPRLCPLCEVCRGSWQPNARRRRWWQRKGAMDASALAALALALQLDGDGNQAQNLLDYLLAQVEETPTSAFWPLPDAGGVE